MPPVKKNKNPAARKHLLILGTHVPKAVTELAALRGDCTILDAQPVDAYSDPEGALRLMSKTRSSLVIPATPTRLTLGRSYDGQFLDLLSFSLLASLPSSSFPTVSPEPSVKYFVLLLGLSDSRLQNLLLDLFRQRTHSVSLAGIRYAWVISQSAPGQLSIKYTRVLTDSTLEDIGPAIELKKEASYACEEETWRQYIEPEKSKKHKEKKTAEKNVERNALREKVGRVYVDKQDLRDVSVRRSGAYKYE